ncbi:unnamed protein product [Lampetra fluviatilis]
MGSDGSANESAAWAFPLLRALRRPQVKKNEALHRAPGGRASERARGLGSPRSPHAAVKRAGERAGAAGDECDERALEPGSYVVLTSRLPPTHQPLESCSGLSVGVVDAMGRPSSNSGSTMADGGVLTRPCQAH